MEEVLIDMRMASKRFEADSRRAEKEKNNVIFIFFNLTKF